MITALSTITDDGAVRFECAGRVVKQGDFAPVTCEQVLMVWRPEATMLETGGTVEVKCRRCKVLNLITLKRVEHATAGPCGTIPGR